MIPCAQARVVCCFYHHLLCSLSSVDCCICIVASLDLTGQSSPSFDAGVDTSSSLFVWIFKESASLRS